MFRKVPHHFTLQKLCCSLSENCPLLLATNLFSSRYLRKQLSLNFDLFSETWASGTEPKKKTSLPWRTPRARVGTPPVHAGKLWWICTGDTLKPLEGAFWTLSRLLPRDHPSSWMPQIFCSLWTFLNNRTLYWVFFVKVFHVTNRGLRH